MNILSHGRPVENELKSERYRLYVNDEEVYAYTCEIGHYAVMSGCGEFRVRIQSSQAYKNVTIKPLRHMHLLAMD